MGFTTYDKPDDVNITVERNCIAKYRIGDYDTVVNVGDCVRVDNVKQLVTKIKVLERNIENYELDINAYKRLHKKKR